MKKLLPTLAAAAAVAAAVTATASAVNPPATTSAKTTAATTTAAKPKPLPILGRTTFRLQALADGTAFDTSALVAKSGAITFTLKNLSKAKHDLVLKQGGKVIGKTKVVAPGKSESFTVTLKKGEYTYECDQDGHAAAGMKGTLKVS